jgi:hypothetical protein
MNQKQTGDSALVQSKGMKMMYINSIRIIQNWSLIGHRYTYLYTYKRNCKVSGFFWVFFFNIANMYYGQLGQRSL